MNPRQNILVTCGGKWVGMVLQLREAQREVSTLKDGCIYVADRATLTPAGCYANGSFVVPPIVDPGYVDRLLDICSANGVRVVVPLIDRDLERLTAHLERFNQIGTDVVCPPPSLVEMCLDKILFNRFALEQGIPVLRLYAPKELRDAAYPLFYKRRRGFGSIGSGICHSHQGAVRAMRGDPDLIFEDYLHAPEASVDAFIASSGDCTVRVPRIRDKVVGGEALQSHTIADVRVHQLASQTIRALSGRGLRGPLNLQMFLTDEPKVIEVNTRLGSASVLSNQATRGALFKSVLRHACGEECYGDPDDYCVGLSLYRFFGDVMHEGERIKAMFPQLPFNA